MIASSKSVSLVGRFTTQTRNGSYIAHIKPATLNEMPVPAGSWAEHFNANQRKYNMHLALGIAAFAATIYAVSNSLF